MNVTIQPVTTSRQLRRFIRLPFEIHKRHALWVPPILKEERRYYDRRRNRAFQYSEAMCFLAYRNKRAVGRIIGLINKRPGDNSECPTARFAGLECYDDREVAGALTRTVEDWARDRGMQKVVGPLGFTDQDPEGFLVEGFEHEPTIATYYNFTYISRLLEDLGYRKEVDYVVYRVALSYNPPIEYQRIAQRCIARGAFDVKQFRRRAELKPYVLPVLRLMNETFARLYGYERLDEEEMRDLARMYMPVIDPRFVMVALCNGELAGFLVGMPNVSEGLRRAKGRLVPFGIYHILRAMKRSRQLDLLMGAIKEEYRGHGLDVVGMTSIVRAAHEAGFACIDSHHELETNLRVRAEMERLGGVVYKRFRVYQKDLREKECRLARACAHSPRTCA
jgi:GNAT superfamily N-acetyltransferase